MKLYKTIITLSILTLNILCLAQFAGGIGTIEDPYLIETADQLNLIRNHMTSSFIQTADIDLGVPPWNEGEGWDPIGDYDWTNPTKSFRGNYNGNDYNILNMNINRTDDTYLGLFGSALESELYNINLMNFRINGRAAIGGLVAISFDSKITNIFVEGSIEGNSEIGLLVYLFDSYFNLENCHSKGEIISTGGGWIGGLVSMYNADSIINCSSDIKILSKDNVVGGLISWCKAGLIENCKSKVDISAIGGSWIGGFIGTGSPNNGPFNIKNCFSEGTMYLEPEIDNLGFGGFIAGAGGEENKQVSITNCFSKVNVTGNKMVGGFVGRLIEYINLDNCYSTGLVTGVIDAGGFAGFIEYPETVTVTNSYWDMDTSDQLTSAAGEGRTTAEMTYPYAENTYADWDFWVTWSRDKDNINDGYPYLSWTNPPTEGVIVQNHIPEQSMVFGETKEIDVSEVFVDVNGSEITITAEGVSDPSVLSAEMLDGNTLTLTAGSFIQDKATVYLKGTSGVNFALYEFKVAVYDSANFTVEDFETSGFLSLPWKFSGDADWIIDSLEVSEGKYSARSGVVTDNQKSEISVDIEYPVSGKIAFYACVAPNVGDDYLKFYIDGEHKLSLSYLNSVYNNHIFSIEAGTHTFKWSYEKDGWSSNESDCAWIDYIVFEGGRVSGIEDIAALPSKNKLYQNYPNPFNPVTQIKFDLAKTQDVVLKIYNPSGQLVSELLNKRMNKGKYSVEFDGSDLNSGIYFCILNINGVVLSRKMVLLK